MSNSTLSGFWVEEWSDLTRFDTFIQTEQPRQGVPEDNLDEPILLPSVQAQIVATSQQFFEEPWVNIDYADREAESTRLFSVYCQAISDRLSDEGVDMDQLFKIDRATVYDDFPDIWDSPVVYELGESVHLWRKTDWVWYLSIFQEDKELPIEMHFGCFTHQDMETLTQHMRAFSAG